MSLGTEHSFKYSTNLQGTRLRVRPCRKFIWVSKVIRNWSDYTSIFDWLRGLTPLSKPAKYRTKTNRELVIRVFGSLHASRAEFSLALCDNSRVSEWCFWSLSVWFCENHDTGLADCLEQRNFNFILSVSDIFRIFSRSLWWWNCFGIYLAGRSNPWKMMANPEWIELFDRNSNERLAASKLASRKKGKQANKLESMSWSSESK